MDDEVYSINYINNTIDSVIKSWAKRRGTQSWTRDTKQLTGVRAVDYANEIQKWQTLKTKLGALGGKKTRRRRKVKRKTLRKKSRRKGNKTKM